MIAAKGCPEIGSHGTDEKRSRGDKGGDHADLARPFGSPARFRFRGLSLLPHLVHALGGLRFVDAGARRDSASQELPVRVLQRAGAE